MGEKFTFDDSFYPVPSSAVDADPAAAIRELLYRTGRLEQTLQEERVRAFVDVKELLLDLVSVGDDVSRIVARYGVTSNAQEAAIIRSVVALGRKLQSIIKHHQANPIATVGKPYDEETSDIVATEVHPSLAPGTVLREEQVGYTWPHGLLRRAQVVVAKPNGNAAPGADAEPTKEDDTDG